MYTHLFFSPHSGTPTFVHGVKSGKLEASCEAKRGAVRLRFVDETKSFGIAHIRYKRSSFINWPGRKNEGKRARCANNLIPSFIFTGGSLPEPLSSGLD